MLVTNIIGKRVGRLIVVEKDEVKSNQIVCIKPQRKLLHYHCVCDCGNKLSVRKDRLLNGKRTTLSCGCLQKEKAAATGRSKKLPPGEKSFNDIYGSYKYRSEKIGVPFCFTKKEFKELNQQCCYYCGAPPQQKATNPRIKTDYYVYNGIDRIDSEKGYENGNVVPCCGHCNKMKLDYSQEEFYSHINKILIYNEIRNKERQSQLQCKGS